MATPTSLPATFVAGNVLTAAQMNDLRGAFRVLQVVDATKTDAFTTTSTTVVDITGASVTITPSSTSSKVLFIAQIGCYGTGSAGVVMIISAWRDSTEMLSGGTANGGTMQQYVTGAVGAYGNGPGAICLLDSPNTTSATTYKLRTKVNGGTGYFNRLAADAGVGAVSTFTVLEISA
jgi:hypothetical protein